MAYQICSNCVMDTSDSKIIFDENGVCDHCLTFQTKIKPYWCPDKTDNYKIDKLVDSIRKASKGKDFDCLIGMSGGIDSSYLTYLAKEKMGLKPLVFHVDAGWNSKEAVTNIERVVEGLGLELFTEVINWEEMKDLQLAFLRSGVSHVDSPQDNAFFATMYKFASKYKVKYILTGGNYSTECVRNPIEWMYYQSDSRQIRDIHKQFGSSRLQTYPLTNILWHKVFLPYVKGIKVVRPLDYFAYNKKEALKLLQEKFGYQDYGQKHFESRFTKFYESYWLPKRFGYDTRRVQLSSLILTNQITREEALKILEKPAYDEATAEREFEYVATKLGISKDELKLYLNLPKQTFKDYKSQDFIYQLGAKTLKFFGAEKGGKR